MATCFHTLSVIQSSNRIETLKSFYSFVSVFNRDTSPSLHSSKAHVLHVIHISITHQSLHGLVGAHFVLNHCANNLLRKKIKKKTPNFGICLIILSKLIVFIGRPPSTLCFEQTPPKAPAPTELFVYTKLVFPIPVMRAMTGCERLW